MSDSNADASERVARRMVNAYDVPPTEDEVTRRTFMANATLTIGGLVGFALAVPIVGSLLPPKSALAGSWSPLSAQELDALQKATAKPVKLTFMLKFTDGYLPEQSLPEYSWGIRVDNNEKFKAARPDIFIRGRRQGRRSLRRRQHGVRDFQSDLSSPWLLLQLERIAKPLHVPVSRIAIYVRRHAHRRTRAARPRSVTAARAERHRRSHVDRLPVKHARAHRRIVSGLG